MRHTHVLKVLLAFNVNVLYLCFVERVHAKPPPTWKEIYRPNFHPPIGNLLSSISRTLISNDEIAPMYHLINRSIPENFDARKEWPYCESISQIENQEKCGTCWAFSTAKMLTDRLCIATKGKDKFEFSMQHLVTCCINCFNEPGITNGTQCDIGASILEAILFLIENGGVSKKCKPYNMTVLNETIGCEKQCTNQNYTVPYDEDKRYPKTLLVGLGELPAFSFETIQMEIMTKGPVIFQINVTQHFTEHAGEGIYEDPQIPDAKFARHAVNVIGWGTENGTHYWLIANSWGEEWGIFGGFFKLLRGSNDLKGEQIFVAADFKEEQREVSCSKIFTISKSIRVFMVIYYFTYWFIL